MGMHGNSLSLDRLRNLAAPESRSQVLALSGPSHLGKASAASQVLEDVLEESDWMAVGPGVAGAREAASFLSSEPAFSPYRAVIVDDAGSLSEPAQDAYLKLCEEPPRGARVWFVTTDDHLMLPALRSRVQEVVRWRPLSREEMGEFLSSLEGATDPDAERMSSGRPGLYLAMAGNAEYRALRDAVRELASGAGGLSSLVPDAVKSLDGKASVRRTAVAEVCRLAALESLSDLSNRARAVALLRFSATLIRHPSANAEVHWQGASICCSL